jgi:hypothetical protein
MRPALVVLALLLVPGPAAAAVYKCKDKDGRIQYTQTQPKDGNCAVTDATPPPPTGANVDDLLKRAGEIDKAREQEASEQQRAARDQAAREARCSNARSRLALLEQSHRVFVMKETGERDYKSEAQKQQLLDEARRSVAAECG